MAYNTILVQFDHQGTADARLAFAADLSRRFDADLIGFCAAEVRPLIPAAEGVSIDGEVMSRLAADMEGDFARLKHLFEEKMNDGDRATWRAFLDNPTRSLLLNARAADLIVTGKADGSLAGDHYRTIDTGELILSAGRPVLIMADEGRPLRAENIVVAWKDTREARRAVADAMPFLRYAKDVLVVTLEDHERAAARANLSDVVRFLMRHGVKARSEVVGHERSEDANTLALVAGNMDADLVVAGGYGHSRMREWAFGGLTRSLLLDGRLNRFFSN